jgi:hypothetical protein
MVSAWFAAIVAANQLKVLHACRSYTVHRGVVHEHECTVLRDRNVELDHMRAQPHRFAEGGQCIFRMRGTATPMRADSAIRQDDIRAARTCCHTRGEERESNHPAGDEGEPLHVHVDRPGSPNPPGLIALVSATAAFHRELDTRITNEILKVFVLLRVEMLRLFQLFLGALEASASREHGERLYAILAEIIAAAVLAALPEPPTS